MMDQNRDGFVDKDDLKDTFASLGRAPSDKEIEEMLNEASGPINFTMFITLFGDKVAGIKFCFADRKSAFSRAENLCTHTSAF